MIWPIALILWGLVAYEWGWFWGRKCLKDSPTPPDLTETG